MNDKMKLLYYYYFGVTFMNIFALLEMVGPILC